MAAKFNLLFPLCLLLLSHFFGRCAAFNDPIVRRNISYIDGQSCDNCPSCTCMGLFVENSARKMTSLCTIAVVLYCVHIAFMCCAVAVSVVAALVKHLISIYIDIFVAHIADIFMPDTNAPAPFVLFFHGG